MNRSTVSLLLAGTALIAIGTPYQQAAAASERPIVLAQAQQPDAAQRREQIQQRREQQQQRTQQQPAPQQQQRTQQQPAQPQQQQRTTQQPAPQPQQQRTQQQPMPQQERQQQQQRTTQQPAQQQQQMEQRRQQPAQAPATEQQRRQQPAQAPATEQQRRQQPAQAPATEQQRRQQPAQAPATEQQRRQQPAQAQPPAQTQQAQPRDASEFIRRGGGGTQARKIDDLRRERHEERVGNQVVIREGDRTIVREGNRTIIRHDEGERFAIGARGVDVQRVGGETRTVVVRPDGSRIVTVTDPSGRLLRRVRQVNGRDIVIIDNRFRRPGYQVFVALPPPVIRIPRERYIVDYRVGAIPAPVVFETLTADPVEPIAERYTLEQVVDSPSIRDRMPRIDLDINFETGSWQLTPDQVDKLSVIADGINKAVQRNPQEVFMIEGYTDAVGNDDDNLSLSDRRAEAVAVALSEQFQVPAENLVTQGYGEQNLKVPTQGPSEENRRVSVRRVTPLLAQGEGTTGGGAGGDANGGGQPLPPQGGQPLPPQGGQQ